MPLSGGTSGAHDDSMHQGNAKRDTVEGLAGLDAGGHVLAPGYRFTAARGAAEQITIRERTSDERAFRFIRVGVNDYEARVNVGGVEKVVQHAGLKNVANGIAALDAAGALLVPGSKIYYTRDGSDDVHIFERTSDEEAYAFHRVGADDYTFFVKESNVWKQMQTESMKNVANGIAGLDASVKLLDNEMPGILDRYTISDDILHSHDASVFVNQAAYTKYKTITITALSPNPSTIRIKFDMKADLGVGTAYGKIYKNGGAVGTERTTTSGSYVTFTEDISFAQGDTLELWSHIGPPNTGFIANFRVCGVGGVVPLSVAIVSGDIGVVDGFSGVNS